MKSRFPLSLILWTFLDITFGEMCSKPVIKSNTYATTDGMVVANVALVSEFSVSCSTNLKDVMLYGDIEGKTLPAMKSMDNSKYQVSWTEDSSKLSSGSHNVEVYDEEGFANLRKAQRSGDDTSNIKAAFILDMYYPGTYFGPLLQSECLAAISSVILWILAFKTKSELLA